MILRPIACASVALLFASPTFAVTEPSTPAAEAAVSPSPADDQVLTPDDFALDDVESTDDQVTAADLADDMEIVDSELGKEQEPDDTVTVEPKDDGQALAQAAEEYLAKTSLKDAEIAAAAQTPRQQQVVVQLPSDTTAQRLAEAPTPTQSPTPKLATALSEAPVDFKNSAFVTKLQQALIAEGAALAVDGKMGAATQTALLDYQKKLGLAADGIAGPRTLAKLGVAP